DRVGRAPFLAGDAVDHQLVGAVVVVGPGLRHAVGIAGAHLLAVGVHHLVVGVGLTGDAVIVDVVHRPIGVPVLGADDRVAIAPDFAERLAVGAIDRVGRAPFLAGDAVDHQLVGAVVVVGPGL